MAAQVAFAQSTEDRVGQRMRRHVGIRMTLQSVRMRDLDPAKDQSASLDQGMEIEALSNPKGHLAKWEQATLTMARAASKLS